MGEEIVVIKQNPAGEETWRYSGVVLSRRPGAVLIEARFNREDTPFYEIVLRNNDRFVEVYYADRWYNIFEIHDRDDDRLKGWYCNVTRPAALLEGEIHYVDLALDLLVYPDGRQVVLDEDEFTELEITDELRSSARAGLRELQAIFTQPVTLNLRAGFPVLP